MGEVIQVFIPLKVKKFNFLLLSIPFLPFQSCKQNDSHRSQPQGATANYGNSPIGNEDYNVEVQPGEGLGNHTHIFSNITNIFITICINWIICFISYFRPSFYSIFYNRYNP